MSATTPWRYGNSRSSVRPGPVAPPAWARRARRLRRPGGELLEVHAIGALAEALGKSSFTIRRWERTGVLPETPFILSVASGPARRLYTTEQIVNIVFIAEEEGVAHRKPESFESTRFTVRVLELYKTLFPWHFQ